MDGTCSDSPSLSLSFSQRRLALFGSFVSPLPSYRRGSTVRRLIFSHETLFSLPHLTLVYCTPSMSSWAFARMGGAGAGGKRMLFVPSQRRESPPRAEFGRASLHDRRPVTSADHSR